MLAELERGARDHSLLGLRWVMTAHRDRPVRVFHPGGDVPSGSPWLAADVGWDERQGLVGRPEVRYAIWKRTGDVYRVQEEGEPYPEAVTDDPVFRVPEGWRTDAHRYYDGGGLWSIQAERVRQIEQEGFTADHDDGHKAGALALAAAVYASPHLASRVEGYAPYIRVRSLWPQGWGRPRRLQDRPGLENADPLLRQTDHETKDRDRWRRLVLPDDLTEHKARIHELAVAGALIAAEIDRLARLGERQGLEYEGSA